jgi:hypothetical protein
MPQEIRGKLVAQIKQCPHRSLQAAPYRPRQDDRRGHRCETLHLLRLSIASNSSSNDRGEIPSERKPRQPFGGRSVDLHKFDLIADEWRLRQPLSKTGQWVP